MTLQVVKLFEKVQKIPYKVCKFEPEKINEKLKEGDCRHKSALLYNLLTKEKYEVKKVKVVFDWRDLPIPKKILSNLKESSFIWDHDSLAVKIKGKWIKIDCTWNPELKKKRFPITENWDGESDTKQVTEGKLEFYDSEKYTKDRRIKIVKEEAWKFADELDKWMK